jgi:hypothetical protein
VAHQLPTKVGRGLLKFNLKCRNSCPNLWLINYQQKQAGGSSNFIWNAQIPVLICGSSTNMCAGTVDYFLCVLPRLLCRPNSSHRPPQVSVEVDQKLAAAVRLEQVLYDFPLNWTSGPVPVIPGIGAESLLPKFSAACTTEGPRTTSVFQTWVLISVYGSPNNCAGWLQNTFIRK